MISRPGTYAQTTFPSAGSTSCHDHVCSDLQAIPYGSVSGAQASKTVSVLHRLCQLGSFRHNTPPWYEKLFEALEARVQAEGANGPIFIMMCGKNGKFQWPVLKTAATHGLLSGGLTKAPPTMSR